MSETEASNGIYPRFLLKKVSSMQSSKISMQSYQYLFVEIILFCDENI